MLSQPLLLLASAVSCRRMKLLLGITLLAYPASAWDNLVNMRSIQENGELRIESRIEESIEPVREKIRDLKKSFTQKYSSVKFLSEKDRKIILVTGDTGFVSSHLTDKLMMDGHKVTVMDNFFKGRKRNMEHWTSQENFELINLDQIYHLVSSASPPNYTYNPIKTLKTNTMRTLNMLGLAERAGARLFLASTSEVYGDPEGLLGPRKRVAEIMCYTCVKQKGVEVRVARIFNTFGPRMHMNDDRVVSNFILQALQGEPLMVYGSGSQTRALQNTILEFAQLIRKLIASGSEIQFLSEAQDDPQRRKRSLNKAIFYFWKELEYQVNNQHIPKPKLARIRKGWIHRN
ncbi:hypothetical protein FD755_005398 [Muntiacus reevesi]|uniref:UDP-glucuronic acid decarboxylase 1 n=1 Tax=Muntiacus reevesi TaxID=9886 RepID=A0A5J5MSH8_MUNRE|nr:hypothetical protein FD755_005398 [Muntiacus reevesi]